MLFATAFLRAADDLRADDIATLARVEPPDVAGLGWIDPGLLARVEHLIDGWADRGSRDRYRLGTPSRDALLAEFGHDFVDDPRRLSLVVALLGRAFARFSDDYSNDSSVRQCAESAFVVPSPTAFLGETPNPPPPLGQMTPIAHLRRWSGAFWYVGPVTRIRALGAVPSPMRVRPPAMTVLALQGAADDEVMRVAAITWPRHASADLRLWERARPSSFAVREISSTGAQVVLDQILEQLSRDRIHVAIFPELVMSAADLAALRSTLGGRQRRFPAVTIIGCAHRRAAAGDRFANVAVAVDATGTIIMEHEKLEPFTDATLGTEDILPRESDCYRYMDTPIGRLVINICRDVRSDVPMLLNRVLGATLLAVPACSKRLDFALEEARVLGARQRAVTIAVNPLRTDGTLRDALALYVPTLGRAQSEYTLGANAALEAAGTACALVQVFEIHAQPHGRYDASTPIAV